MQPAQVGISRVSFAFQYLATFLYVYALLVEAVSYANDMSPAGHPRIGFESLVMAIVGIFLSPFFTKLETWALCLFATWANTIFLLAGSSLLLRKEMRLLKRIPVYGAFLGVIAVVVLLPMSVDSERTFPAGIRELYDGSAIWEQALVLNLIGLYLNRLSRSAAPFKGGSLWRAFVEKDLKAPQRGARLFI